MILRSIISNVFFRIPFFLLLVIPLGGADNVPDKSRMTAFEYEILAELNKVRKDPAGYAEEYIKPMLDKFDGKVYDKKLLTREGSKAVKECINELKKTKPLTIFTAKEELVKAARYHTERQGKTEEVGHTSPDGTTFQARLKGIGYVGEVISYGKNTAREIVVQLLVDDGVPDRGHRKNILNKEFTHAGVAFGEHQKYKFMCTIDFSQVKAETASKTKTTTERR